MINFKLPENMNYEMLYIIPAPYTEKDVPEVTKQVKELIKSLGGEILEEENWGLRTLAYPIKKVKQGFYILVYFSLPCSQVKELSSKLELRKDVLRFLILRKEKEEKGSTQKAKRRSLEKREQELLLKKEKQKELKDQEVKQAEKKEKIDLDKIDQEIDKLLDL